MKKRGMSTVITTLILIVLVLTAVAIIWAVISNMISEGTEDVGLGAFTISLDIEKITLKENTIDVQVKRNQCCVE